MTDTLVISHDNQVLEQLRRLLVTRHQRSVMVAHSCREATAVLQQQPPVATVFLDLRKSISSESPAGLLNHIRVAGQPAQVIAISDEGYVRDWAVVADQTICGHVQLPFNHVAIAQLLEHRRNRAADQLPPARPTSKVVHGKSISYETFTPSMFKLLDDLVTVAKHDVTILLVGETGTGKTTLARLIHELSSRNDARFLDVACGALAPELIESELFGHAKGAFTSASQAKAGKFEVAGSGSLLLDEIDVLGLSQQAKLLRVIETGEFEPVGSNDTRVSQARLIVASNVNLKSLTEQDAFRPDLYYRLSMLECHIPPLRERPHDIAPLTLKFVDEFCDQHDVQIRRIHPDFLDSLKSYHWPGNLRELKNHVRRAVLFCESGILTPQDLGPQFRGDPRQLEQQEEHDLLMPAQVKEGESLAELVAQSERRILQYVLKLHNNNRTATAKALKLSRVGLYKKMKKHGLIAQRDECQVKPR